jgi:phage baseplate assembly protein gpV
VAQAYEVDSDLSITISGTSGVTVKCGASSIALTPSSISMSAPQITINADAMLTLKGGTVAIN